MKVQHVFFLINFAFLLSVGQMLLKKGIIIAQQQASSSAVAAKIIALVWTWQFWSAMALCGSLVLLWSWILTVVPLAKAYPFVVLAFVFAAILEHYFFGLSLSPKFFLGCALIVSGLLVILQQ